MVMISYARRLRKPQEPLNRSFRRPASGPWNARRRTAGKMLRCGTGQKEPTMTADRYALLVVDMQNGFCHLDGSFPRIGRGLEGAQA